MNNIINNKPKLIIFKRISIIFLLASILVTFVTTVVTNAGATGANLACGSFPINVADASELAEAIGCFNAETTAGAYEINLTADIPITSSLVAIDNDAAGVSLELVGNGFKIDGQNIAGTRPLAVYTSTIVVLNDIQITGGHVDAIPGAVRNLQSGGAIINYGDLTLDNTVVISNVAEYWGGGIFSESGAKLTILNSRVAENRTELEDGGGVQNFGDLIIDNSVIENNQAERLSGGIGISAGGSAISITNSSILNNTAQQGAGIYSRNSEVLISHSTISGNVASSFGGGLLNNRSSAVLTITNSTLSGNSADNSGGGIYNDRGAHVIVLNTTITGNSASNSDNSGGGIFNDSESFATVQNTTISGNVSDYAVANKGEMTLTHATIASNRDSLDVAGIGFKNLTATVPSQLFMRNTVIANHVTDCSNDEAGAIMGNVKNLIETDAAGAEACAGGDTLSGDPELIALADNGGPTLTHIFADTSPLINAADSAVCSGMIGGSIDQRGLPRPAGSCDIGAIELIAGISIGDAMVTGVNPGDAPVSVVFTLTRSDNSEAMSVVVNTADGTAVAGEDYTAVVSQTVSFTAGGSLSENVSVEVIGDNEFEDDETFKLLISDPVNVAIIDNEGIGTIKENKTIKLVMSAPASVDEQDSGTSDYTFTFTLDSATAAPFTLNYQTQDGTAMVGDADYEFRSDTLNFSGDAGLAGAESFTVKISGDTKAEDDETFSVVVNSISDPNVGVSPASFEAVIKNDDEPLVNLASAVYTGTESAGSIVVRVELSTSYDQAIMVDVKTADGTATAGSDYTAVSETLTFAPGQTAKDVTITLLDNGGGEDDETFMVSLSNFVNGVAGTQTTATVTIAGDGQTSVYLPIVMR